jgi:hypothetical protein
MDLSRDRLRLELEPVLATLGPLLCKRFVSRDTGRQMPRILFMHATFDARQIGGEIVSVLPMSFRIDEWKLNPCVIYLVYWRIVTLQ